MFARSNLDFRSELTRPGRVDLGPRVVKVGRSAITIERALFQDQAWATNASTIIVHVTDGTRCSQPLSRSSD